MSGILNNLRELSSMAPRVCPQCEGENTFVIEPARIICRRCGYTLRREDGKPMSPAERTPPRVTEPRQPLLPSYRITHRGEINPWAEAAFNTAQDHIRRQQWDEAVQAFYRALDNQSDFVDAHLWIARIVSDPDVRLDHLTTILAEAPNHIEARQELMVLRGQLGANSRAFNPFHDPEIRPAGGAVEADTVNVRCAACGSTGLETDDITGLTVCRSCGQTVAESSGSAGGAVSLTEALLKRRDNAVIWQVGERLLRCNSCGAERAIPAGRMSDECLFCGSRHVVQADALKSFQQPDGIIPFRVSKEQAGAAIKSQLARWTERVSGWFNRNAVKRATLNGVYLPYWVFDAYVNVNITTMADLSSVMFSGDSRNDGPPVGYSTDEVSDAIPDVPVCAVTSPPPLLTHRIAPFNVSHAEPFTPESLGSRSAELYSIDFDKASLEARSAVSDMMRRRHGTHTGHGVQSNVFTSFLEMQFRLLLLPVWVAVLHEEDGDVRQALVNGQTGEVALGRATKPRN